VDAARAAATQRAILELSGEVGYRQVTVAALLERSGTNRSWFYKAYAGKPDCFAKAYAQCAGGLCEEVLDACRTVGGGAAGVRAAMGVLSDFLATDPTLARGLFAEAQVAGGDAVAGRNKVFERLSRGIGSARRETSRSRHSPPPATTAIFILDAIEAAVTRALLEPGAFDALPEELASLVLSYGPLD
jgi:AcrR family transcriptional regulator